MMALNIGLALSDLSGGTALVKGLAVGTMKFASRKAIRSIFKSTTNWRSMRGQLQRIGEVTKNALSTNKGDWLTTDHIFFKQRGKWPHWLLNHPANLQTGVPQRLNSMFEGMGAIERSMYWPTWMKATAGGATSYGAGWFVGSGSEPE